MAAGITINGSSIAKALVGSSEVGKIYLNGVKVYDSTPPAPTGSRITIYISCTNYEYFMTEGTLTVDGEEYGFSSTIGDYWIGYPYSGQEIRANTVSIDGAYYRWKDSNTPIWQNRVPKTWTNMPDGFEIWIEIPMDE